MKRKNKIKKYYTNEIDLSDSKPNFPVHLSSENNQDEDKDKFTIIGERISSNLIDSLIRYIIPSYLIKAYENFQTINILKDIDLQLYLKRILNTSDPSIFISEDYYREEYNDSCLIYDSVEENLDNESYLDSNYYKVSILLTFSLVQKD